MDIAVTIDGRLALRYLTRDTLVATGATTHVEWLRDCLAPHFDAQRARAGDWTVTFTADPDGYRALASLGRTAGGEAVPFFTLDSGLAAFPQWNGGRAGDIVAFDDEFDVFYSVRRERCEVDVLARDLRPWGRVALLRVVRELAMEEAYAAGGIFLHAAALEHDGIVHLIAGPKHAGKTTLLIHLLTSGETRFVANDRALVVQSARGRVVRGMPTLVNVRPATRAFFASRFDPHGFGPDSACLTPAEHAAGLPCAVARCDEPIILNPRQFAESLGAPMSTGGRLGAILFPVVSAAHEGIELTPLPRSAAQAHLASALFPSVSRSDARSAFGGRPPGESFEREWLSTLAAQQIPMLRCSLGHDAYERGATSVLDALREHAAA
jgi:hypothetical protein